MRGGPRRPPMWRRVLPWVRRHPKASAALAALFLLLLIGALLPAPEDGTPVSDIVTATPGPAPSASLPALPAPVVTTSAAPPAPEVATEPTRRVAPPPVPTSSPPPAPSAYYANCAEARAAGAAPLYLSEPGYRPGLDRDGDGDACE